MLIYINYVFEPRRLHHTLYRGSMFSWGLEGSRAFSSYARARRLLLEAGADKGQGDTEWLDVLDRWISKYPLRCVATCNPYCAGSAHMGVCGSRGGERRVRAVNIDI